MAKYNQDGGGGAGTATANPSTDTATPQPAAPAPSPAAAPEAPKTPEAPPKGDREVYEAAKAKLQKDRSYRLTPEEANAVRNVQTGKAKQGPKAEATPAPAPEAPKTPEVPAPFKAAMERLKVEKPEDLPTSVEKLQAELQKLNGERGNLGPLQERLQSANRTTELQHAIIRDLVAGKPEALEWAKKNAQTLGIDPAAFNKPAATPAPQQAGEWSPDTALDVETAKYVKGLEGKLEQAMAELKAVKENTEKYGKFYETELEKQARENSLQGAIGLVQKLLDTEGVSGLYDRRHGPIAPFLEKFFKDPHGNYPQIQNVIELLRLANESKLDDLEMVYPIWQWKNRGKQAVAAASAQAPQLAPTVGLSDRQEGNGGRVNVGPTVEEVLSWADKGKPIPPEYKDKSGRFLWSKIPAEVRAEVERRRGRK